MSGITGAMRAVVIGAQVVIVGGKLIASICVPIRFRKDTLDKVAGRDVEYAESFPEVHTQGVAERIR